MPFARPALADLIARVTQQIQARLPGTDPSLRRAVSAVLGQVLAQELNLEYGYLDFIASTVFVRTAPGEYLDFHGAPYKLPRLEAVAAQLVVFGGGVPTTPIPAGSIMQAAANNVLYATQANATIGADGTVGIYVTALSAGAGGNIAIGTLLTLAVAIGGVNATFTAGGSSVTGLDDETDDAYRARILVRQQLPPQGGASRDYVAWLKQLPGLTRAWVYPSFAGLGTVGVAGVFDGRGGFGIFMEGSDINDATAILSQDAPVTATYLFPTLTPLAVNIELHNLSAQSGYTVATALANATISLGVLFGVAPPGGAGYGDGIVQTASGPSTAIVTLADIYDAIKQSPGVADFDLAAPTADIVPAALQLPVLGTVTPV